MILNRYQASTIAVGVSVFLCSQAALLAQPDRSRRNADQNPPLLQIDYPVADLVFTRMKENGESFQCVASSLPVEANADVERGMTSYRLGESAAKTQLNYQPVVDLIVNSIDPGSWAGKGGVGQVWVASQSASLRIIQTESVHREILELFSELRKPRVFAVLKVESIRLSESDAKVAFAAPELANAFSGTGGPRQAMLSTAVVQNLREVLEHIDVIPHEVIEMAAYDGDRQELVIGHDEGTRGGDWRLRSMENVAPTGRSVEVTLTVSRGDSLEAAGHARSATITAGDSWLIDITGDLDGRILGRAYEPGSAMFRRIQQASGVGAGRRVLLLVTPTAILKQQEEEVVPFIRKVTVPFN